MKKNNLIILTFTFILLLIVFNFNITAYSANIEYFNNNTEAIVYNATQFKEAITSPTVTNIYLGADIDFSESGGMIANTTSKTQITIDGINPNDVTQTRHKIKENTASNTSHLSNVYVQTKGLLTSFTVKNLIIEGYNWYSTFTIESTLSNITQSFKNVDYEGPQMTFNPYGDCEYIDCNIVINDASNSQEIGEVRNVTLGGNIFIDKINNNANNLFYMYETTASKAFVNILPNSNITISNQSEGSSSFAYGNAGYTFTIGDNAKFNYHGYRSFHAGIRPANFIVNNGAKVDITVNGRTSDGLTETPALTVSDTLQINDGADVKFKMINNKSAQAAVVISSKLIINNPKSLLFYNDGTNAAAKALTISSASNFDINTKTISFWKTASGNWNSLGDPDYTWSNKINNFNIIAAAKTDGSYTTFNETGYENLSDTLNATNFNTKLIKVISMQEGYKQSKKIDVKITNENSGVFTRTDEYNIAPLSSTVSVTNQTLNQIDNVNVRFVYDEDIVQVLDLSDNLIQPSGTMKTTINGVTKDYPYIEKNIAALLASQTDDSDYKLKSKNYSTNDITSYVKAFALYDLNSVLLTEETVDNALTIPKSDTGNVPITIKKVNLLTSNEIEGAEIVPLQYNTNLEIVPKYIDGYTYSGQAYYNGLISNLSKVTIPLVTTEQEITFYYDEIGSIIVQHNFATGTHTEVIPGKVGTDGEATSWNKMSTWNLDSTDHPKGTPIKFSKDNVSPDIIFNYTRNRSSLGDIIIEYIDIDTGYLIRQSMVSGTVGSDYVVNPIELLGYTLVDPAIPGTLTKTFGKNVEIVQYKYKRNNDYNGSILDTKKNVATLIVNRKNKSDNSLISFDKYLLSNINNDNPLMYDLTNAYVDLTRIGYIESGDNPTEVQLYENNAVSIDLFYDTMPLQDIYTVTVNYMESGVLQGTQDVVISTADVEKIIDITELTLPLGYVFAYYDESTPYKYPIVSNANVDIEVIDETLVADVDLFIQHRYDSNNILQGYNTDGNGVKYHTQVSNYKPGSIYTLDSSTFPNSSDYKLTSPLNQKVVGFDSAASGYIVKSAMFKPLHANVVVKVVQEVTDPATGIKTVSPLEPSDTFTINDVEWGTVFTDIDILNRIVIDIPDFTKDYAIKDLTTVHYVVIDEAAEYDIATNTFTINAVAERISDVIPDIVNVDVLLSVLNSDTGATIPFTIKLSNFPYGDTLTIQQITEAADVQHEYFSKKYKINKVNNNTEVEIIEGLSYNNITKTFIVAAEGIVFYPEKIEAVIKVNAINRLTGAEEEFTITIPDLSWGSELTVDDVKQYAISQNPNFEELYDLKDLDGQDSIILDQNMNYDPITGTCVVEALADKVDIFVKLVMDISVVDKDTGEISVIPVTFPNVKYGDTLTTEDLVMAANTVNPDFSTDYTLKSIKIDTDNNYVYDIATNTFTINTVAERTSGVIPDIINVDVLLSILNSDTGATIPFTIKLSDFPYGDTLTIQQITEAADVQHEYFSKKYKINKVNNNTEVEIIEGLSYNNITKTFIVTAEGDIFYPEKIEAVIKVTAINRLTGAEEEFTITIPNLSWGTKLTVDDVKQYAISQNPNFEELYDLKDLGGQDSITLDQNMNYNPITGTCVVDASADKVDIFVELVMNISVVDKETSEISVIPVTFPNVKYGDTITVEDLVKAVNRINPDFSTYYNLNNINGLESIKIDTDNNFVYDIATNTISYNVETNKKFPEVVKALILVTLNDKTTGSQNKFSITINDLAWDHKLTVQEVIAELNKQKPISNSYYSFTKIGGKDFVILNSNYPKFDIAKSEFTIEINVEKIASQNSNSIYQITTEKSSGSTIKSSLDNENKSSEQKNPNNLKPSLENVNNNAYLFGYADGTIKPEGKITRAEVASILYRLYNSNSSFQVTDSNLKFSDVDSDEWYAVPISFLTNYEIIKGYDDGTFRPNKPISRAEFITLVLRNFNKLDSKKTKLPFKDIQGSWAYESIMTAYENNFISGYEDKTFRPENEITRAEAVVILNKIMRRPDIYKTENKFSDLDSNSWYYSDMMKAANGY